MAKERRDAVDTPPPTAAPEPEQRPEGPFWRESAHSTARPVWLPRWQGVARLGLAAGLLGFGTVVFQGIRERVDPVAARVIDRLDPEAVIDTIGCDVVQGVGGLENFTLEATRCLTYEDGSVRFLEGVRLDVAEQSDRESFLVTGTEATASGTEADITVSGDVRLATSDGLVIHTEMLAYTRGQSLVTMHDDTQPTTLTRSGLEASGRNPVYDRDQAIVTLRETATVRLTGDDDRATVDIRSARALLAHADKYMHFDGGVIVRTGQLVLQAENTTAHFGEEETALERLELRQDAHVRSTEPTAGGLRELRAAEMTLEFEDATRVLERVMLAGASTIELVGSEGGLGARIGAATMVVTMAPHNGDVTALEARDGVRLELPVTSDGAQQEIGATTLSAPATPGTGLTSVRFDQGVEYREWRAATNTTAAVSRSIRAERLEAGIEEGFSALFDARFLGDVRFTDGTRQATADEAAYDLANGVVTLSTGGAAGRAATLTDGTKAIELTADVMTINLRQTAPTATAPPELAETDDPERTQPLVQPPPTMTLPTPEPAVPVAVQAVAPAEADVRAEAQVALPVEAEAPVEVDNLGRAYSIALVGHEVSLDGSAVEASGGVKSVLTPGGGASSESTSGKMPALLEKGEQVFVSADALLYEGDGGQVTYTGHAHLWQGASSFEGDTVELDDATGDLTASGSVRTSIQLVRLNEATQRNEVSQTRAEADTFVYDNAARTAVYDATAVLRSEHGDLKADMITVFLEADGRTLDRLEATGQVKLRLNGRWASGERLVYYEAEGRYEMEGAPVEIVEEVEPEETTPTTPPRPRTSPPPPSCRSTTGRALTFYRSTDTVSVDGREVLRTETINQRCTPLVF